MFWQTQALHDVFTLATMLGWGLLLALLLFFPRLMSVIATSYRYKRIGAVSLYVARFLPYWAFELVLDLSKSFALTLAVLSWLWRAEMLPTSLSAGMLWGYILGGTWGLWGLCQLRRGSFGLWRYVFMPSEAAEELQKDQMVISLLVLVLSMPVALVALNADLTQFAPLALFSILTFALLLRIVQTIRRLSTRSDGYVYIFLYLCTHELLPWLYIGLAVWFTSHGVFDKLI